MSLKLHRDLSIRGIYVASGAEVLKGQILEDRVERGVQVMSDIWEDVRYITYAYQDENFVTKFASIGINFQDEVTIDANTWMVELYAEFKAKKIADREAQAAEYLRLERKEREEQENKTPRVGKTVKVVRGRKIPKGTVARVFWYGNSGFGLSVGLEIVESIAGINVTTKKFTSANNVEVVL